MLSTLAIEGEVTPLFIPMITIALEGMRFHAPIGMYPEETLLGNEIVVDVYLNVGTNHNRADDLKNSVNYEVVYEQVKIILMQPAHLLENVCRDIIMVVSQLSILIEAVQVRVSKLHPPMAGRIDRVFVEEEWVRNE